MFEAKDLMQMCKEAGEIEKCAGSIVYDCGHTEACRCMNKHVTERSGLCCDCKQKQAEELQEAEPVGKKVVRTAKDVGGKVVGGAAAIATGLNSLGTPTPALQINPRY